MMAVFMAVLQVMVMTATTESIRHVRIFAEGS